MTTRLKLKSTKQTDMGSKHYADVYLHVKVIQMVFIVLQAG